MDTSRVSTFSFLFLVVIPVAPGMAEPVVEVEEIVTQYAPANNGAGPMWCFGSTCVVRHGDDVYVSAIETGKDVPPLCNCRWQLWRRSLGGWKLVQHEENYRQREPCPIGIFHGGPLFLSVNPSTEPPGVKYGPCHPQVLEFDSRDLGGPFKTHEPVWAEGTTFTDHSYRGFAADGAGRELLLLNINAKTSKQFVSYRDRQGTWRQKGTITFPIRACYPQVALCNHSAHVLAIGDIVEPNEEWRELKRQKTGAKWDYVFRRLFYTYTPDIRSIPFIEPIEVASAEKTGGHVWNLDLHVDADNAAHLLYTREPYANAHVHEAYFPDEPRTKHLEYAIVKNGKVISRRVLVERVTDTDRVTPGWGRFHVTPDEELYFILAGTLTDAKGRVTQANFIARIGSPANPPELHRLALKHPFQGALSFFAATPRGGSKPSEVIDLLGATDEPNTLRYARIRLKR